MAMLGSNSNDKHAKLNNSSIGMDTLDAIQAYEKFF